MLHPQDVACPEAAFSRVRILPRPSPSSTRMPEIHASGCIEDVVVRRGSECGQLVDAVSCAISFHCPSRRCGSARGVRSLVMPVREGFLLQKDLMLRTGERGRYRSYGVQVE